MEFVSEQNTRFEASRSSGPGGQNVNKRSTKIQVWTRVFELPVSEKEKRMLRKKLQNRINQDDELEVSCDGERSQAANRAKALTRMNEIIAEALIVSPPRIPTNPSRGAQEAAREHERKRYQRKKIRRASKQPNLAEEEENL